MVILLTLIVLGPWLLRQLMEYHPDADRQHPAADRLMLELTNAQIGGWIASFVLPLFRVAALLMTMPVIGTQLVPVRVRLYLALGVCVVLVPNLPRCRRWTR